MLGTLPAARCSRVSPAALRSPPCPWGQSLRSLNLRLDALALHVRWHGTRGTGPVSSPVTGQLLPTRKRPCWSLGAVTASGKVVLTSVSGKLARLRAPRLWSVRGSMPSSRLRPWARTCRADGHRCRTPRPVDAVPPPHAASAPRTGRTGPHGHGGRRPARRAVHLRRQDSGPRCQGPSTTGLRFSATHNAAPSEGSGAPPRSTGKGRWQAPLPIGTPASRHAHGPAPNTVFVPRGTHSVTRCF